MQLVFGDFVLDLDRRELLVAGASVHLERRAFDVLVHLVHNRDRAVPKTELLDEVWGDRFVSEATLAGNIRQIRAAVGDDGRAQAVIGTVHGHGYRFVADVDEVDEVDQGPMPERGNLPLSMGALIGRDVAMSELVDAVLAHRLVSVVGPGGVGKTRLALETAQRLAGMYPDGIWLIPLDTAVDGEEVERLVLSTLEIETRTGWPFAEAILAGLRAQRCLLVLDNCEHLLDPVNELVGSILRSCPGVHILATSREPLEVGVEWVQPLGALPVTSQGGDAVALFEERARQAGRTLDPVEDREAVVAICELVEGLPLALELAAARVRSLTPQEIRERLEVGFGVLAASRRRGPARHRTIEATLRWSFDLLTVPEQRLLARLSIFRGSFDLDAVEGVGGGTELAGLDIVDLLHQLSVRSLVSVEAVHGRSRYRLHETVRQFARAELELTGEVDEVADRHAQWFLGLLDRADAGWRRGEEQQWWPVARADMANFRSAFERFIATSNVDAAQHMAVAAYGPVVMHFDLEPELSWAPRACDLDPGHLGPFTARALGMAAFGLAKRADLEGAAARARSALEALEAGSPDDGLVTLGATVIPMFGGPRVASRDFAREAADAALASQDLNRIVWVLTFTWRASEAIPYARQQGNLVNLAIAMRAALLMEASRGRPPARKQLVESLAIAREAQSSTTRSNATLDLALHDVEHGLAVEACGRLGFLAPDWLKRGDARAWTALAGLAVALEKAGDDEGAQALADAIVGRPVMKHPLLPNLAAQLEALRPKADPQDTRWTGRDLGPAVEDAVALGLSRLERLGIAPIP